MDVFGPVHVHVVGHEYVFEVVRMVGPKCVDRTLKLAAYLFLRNDMDHVEI